MNESLGTVSTMNGASDGRRAKAASPPRERLLTSDLRTNCYDFPGGRRPRVRSCAMMRSA